MTVIIALLIAALAGLYWRWRVRYRYPPRNIPQTLCFHKLSRQFCWEGTWMTPERFINCIDDLSARGYRFVSESEYLSALENPGDADRSRELFLTFDDGYEQVYTEAFPVLRARDIPFHVFVLSGYVGEENRWDLSLGRRPVFHASWDQLRTMIDAGVTVGSHTVTHRDLTRLSEDELEIELLDSRRAIEEALGVTVRTVSYPFGRYNSTAERVANRVGYEAAFSLYPHQANDIVSQYALRRNSVYVIDNPRSVRAKLMDGAGFWFEEMKCRSINAVAVLTPLLKRR